MISEFVVRTLRRPAAAPVTGVTGGNIQSEGALVGPQNTVQSASLFVFKLIPFSVRFYIHADQFIPETAKTKSESSRLGHCVWNELP